MRTGLIAVAAALLAACAAAGPTPEPTAQPSPEPIEGSWRLESGIVDGVDMGLLEEHPITLTFRGTDIGGTSACNAYGSRIRFAADGIRLGIIEQTAMGCAPGPMELEARYIAALQRVRSFERQGERLVAWGTGVELRFVTLPPPPTAEVVDTTWLLEALVVDDVGVAPMGEPPTLELRSDGIFDGSTGCRTFHGRWLEGAGQLGVTAMDMSGDCPPALSQQDGHVVGVIGDGFVPTVDGDRLTLSKPTGEALVYRSAD